MTEVKAERPEMELRFKDLEAIFDALLPDIPWRVADDL